ncbi:MAG: hypothetical protein KIS66_04415 [Fimbriimonadaceae bacterium]|nr:hypothetical protein [Fimbriimonadaceae bacterium]
MTDREWALAELGLDVTARYEDVEAARAARLASATPEGAKRVEYARDTLVF